MGGGDKPDAPEPKIKPTPEPRSKVEADTETAKRRRVKQSKQSGLLSTVMNGGANEERKKRLLGQ